MRIKLDENIPASIANSIAALGHDVDTVVEEGIKGADDPTVWAAAHRESRFLVTQDIEFADSRERPPGTHHGVLLVRMKEPGRLALSQHLISLFGSEDVEAWAGCIVVATERKVRVRRPG